jgi:hypothetical protein
VTGILVFVLADDTETGLRVFAPAADDGSENVDGGEVAAEQRALARLDLVAEDARDFAAHAKAANTLKAYRMDWAHFSQWCALHCLESLPAEPQTVALYLSDLASTYKVSTLYRRLSSISQAHQAASLYRAALVMVAISSRSPTMRSLRSAAKANYAIK